MPTPLIMRRRPKPPRRSLLQLDSIDVAVERQIEIQSRLLAVRDHIQPGSDLIVHGRDHRIFLKLSKVCGAKLIQVARGKLEPSGKWITADNGSSQRTVFHSEPYIFIQLRQSPRVLVIGGLE